MDVKNLFVAGNMQMEDLEYVVEQHEEDLKKYRNSSVLVSGATGFVGKMLVKTFLLGNRKKNLGIHVIAAIRDQKKAEREFNLLLKEADLELYVGDITEPIDYKGNVDYIFHTASVTTSKTMIEKPVETLNISCEGTKNILELARKKQTKGIVYLSSMEVYGTPDPLLERVTEKELGYVDLTSARSCYPEGKRLCECLCAAYSSEYKLPVRIARLAQTFGAGVSGEDNRVYAQFARSAIHGEDIVLHTAGTSEGNYCYIRDVVAALLLLGTCGSDGEAYNVVNEESHMQIREMAMLVADEVAHGRIKTRIEIPETDCGYAPSVKMHLSGEKLRKLGWKPQIGMRETYERMIADMIAE